MDADPVNADLDGRLGIFPVPGGFLPSRASFHQQFQVGRARVVVAEAMMQCVAEPVETQIVTAPRIGTVEKRTMRPRLVFHALCRRHCGHKDYRQTGNPVVNLAAAAMPPVEPPLPIR